MARVKHHRGGASILPEGEEERALLAFGLSSGRSLVLLGGFYHVGDNALLLPEGIGQRAAQEVCRAFEDAAARHQLAVQKRRGFRLLKE